MLREQVNERTDAEHTLDASALNIDEAMSGNDGEGAPLPIQERYRALLSAHVETLAQLSDLQLDYSRLLNAATRAQQELGRLRVMSRVSDSEREELGHLRAKSSEWDTMLNTVWRNGVQEAHAAREYAASLEVRLDRVNRSLIRRVIYRITKKAA